METHLIASIMLIHSLGKCHKPPTIRNTVTKSPTLTATWKHIPVLHRRHRQRLLPINAEEKQDIKTDLLLGGWGLKNSLMAL